MEVCSAAYVIGAFPSLLDRYEAAPGEIGRFDGALCFLWMEEVADADLGGPTTVDEP
jgi:hypothetical protein